jgi:hypothetical protein
MRFGALFVADDSIVAGIPLAFLIDLSIHRPFVAPR